MIDDELMPLEVLNVYESGLAELEEAVAGSEVLEEELA